MRIINTNRTLLQACPEYDWFSQRIQCLFSHGLQQYNAIFKYLPSQETHAPLSVLSITLLIGIGAMLFMNVYSGLLLTSMFVVPRDKVNFILLICHLSASKYN